jgi:hypothetical protein
MSFSSNLSLKFNIQWFSWNIVMIGPNSDFSNPSFFLSLWLLVGILLNQELYLFVHFFYSKLIYVSLDLWVLVLFSGLWSINSVIGCFYCPIFGQCKPLYLILTRLYYFLNFWDNMLFQAHCVHIQCTWSLFISLFFCQSETTPSSESIVLPSVILTYCSSDYPLKTCISCNTWGFFYHIY